MKRGLLIPAALLAAVLAFCLWNGAAMSAHTARWRAQLEEADRLVLLEDWQGAAAAIRAAYAGWTERQTYLHCVTGTRYGWWRIWRCFPCGTCFKTAGGCPHPGTPA